MKRSNKYSKKVSKRLSKKRSNKFIKNLGLGFGIGLVGTGAILTGLLVKNYMNGDDKPLGTKVIADTRTLQEIYDDAVTAAANESIIEAQKLKQQQEQREQNKHIAYQTANHKFTLKWFTPPESIMKFMIDINDITEKYVVLANSNLMIYIKMLMHYTVIHDNNNSKNSGIYRVIGDQPAEVINRINTEYKKDMMQYCGCNLMEISNIRDTDQEKQIEIQKVAKQAMALTIYNYMHHVYEPDVEFINMYNYLKHADPIVGNKIVDNLDAIKNIIVDYLGTDTSVYKDFILYSVCFMKFLENAREMRYNVVSKHINIDTMRDKLMIPTAIEVIAHVEGEAKRVMKFNGNLFKSGYTINTNNHESHIVLHDINDGPNILYNAITKW